MGGARLGSSPRLAAVVSVGLLCGLLAAPASSSAAKRRHGRVASVSVQLPKSGDVTLARVVLKVKLVRGTRSVPHRTLKFSLINSKHLARSMVILVAGKRVRPPKAITARLISQSGQTATFVAAIAIFSPQPGAGIPHAHKAATADVELSVATFTAQTDEEDTTIVSVEFHQNVLGSDQHGQIGLCPKGAKASFEFTRSQLSEVNGPQGLSEELLEELFDQAVEVCVGHSNAALAQLLAWLDPASAQVTAPVAPPPLPALPTFGGNLGGTTNTAGDPLRISISGQFDRAISGVTVWAPPNTHFTSCDPIASCKIEGYGGGIANSVYFTVQVPANQPLPAGLNLELDHPGNYTDTFQGQAKAQDGTLTPWMAFNLSG